MLPRPQGMLTSSRLAASTEFGTLAAVVSAVALASRDSRLDEGSSLSQWARSPATQELAAAQRQLLVAKAAKDTTSTLEERSMVITAAACLFPASHAIPRPPAEHISMLLDFAAELHSWGSEASTGAGSTAATESIASFPVWWLIGQHSAWMLLGSNVPQWISMQQLQHGRLPACMQLAISASGQPLSTEVERLLRVAVSCFYQMVSRLGDPQASKQQQQQQADELWQAFGPPLMTRLQVWLLLHTKSDNDPDNVRGSTPSNGIPP